MKKISVFIAFLLLACGPVMHTDYEIVPPQTQSGRSCANTCLQAAATCRAQCQAATHQCEAIEQLNAQSDYMSYLFRQQRFGRPPIRSEGDFYRYYACQSNCQEACQNDYLICHTNCGGQAIPHTTCTAFCPEE